MPDPVFLSGADVPSYLKGVELMTAGMQWPGMNGPCTVTMEHLADAVRAYDDPHIQPPRIKLGHTSPINGDHPDYDPFAAIDDAEPAFGQFVNLRLENDGAVLVGDADNVPAWLAEAALSAYPNRSAEGDWDVTTPGAFGVVGGKTDVQTNGGQRYSFVCTAVSLLGVYAPAISDLEDLQTLIMSGPAALTEKQPVAAAAAGDGAAMSVSYDTIWDRSLRWLREHKPDWPYAWTRDVRVDPDECIVDDDDGHLWSLPFSTDGGDEITFGPELAPRAPVQYPEAKAPVAASRLVASFARPSSKPSPKSAASAAPSNAATTRPEPEGVQPMDADVREFLAGRGIDPDTATEVQINAATVLMAEQPAATPPGEGDAPPEPQAATPPQEADEQPAGESETTGAERVPVAASAASDPIALAQKQAFDSLAAEVASLRAERDAANLAATTKRRDEKVTAALSAGRITPAEREHYRGLMDVDEERAGQLLEALPAGRVPLEARATAPDPEGVGDDGLTSADRALLSASRERMGFKAEVA